MAGVPRAGRDLLTAYVWPDQRHRLERLRAAFRVAGRRPAAVHAVDARAFVDRLDGESRVLGVARPHGVPVTWA